MSTASIATTVGPRISFEVRRFHAPNARMSAVVAAQRRFQVAQWIAAGVDGDPEYFEKPGSLDLWLEDLSRITGWTRSDLSPSLRFAQEKMRLQISADGSAKVSPFLTRENDETDETDETED